jgi:hypothetical protein
MEYNTNHLNTLNIPSMLMNNKLFQYAATCILYTSSILFSFLFAGLFIRPLSLKELEEDEEENKQFLKRLEEENFEYKYLNEYERLEEKEVDLSQLKETMLEIPFLKATIIMFYEDETFKYYCNTDVIYKYLNVVCRKFIVENDAKKLYVDGIKEEVKTDSVKSNLFITKSEITTFERKINRFIRFGTIYDYNEKHNIKLVKEIDILEFLKYCKDLDKVD